MPIEQTLSRVCQKADVHPIEKILLENSDNPRALFIFPTDLACSRWADQLLRRCGGGTLAMNKFIAWDTFKENSARSRVQKKKSIPGVLRKMFVSALVAENAELCAQGKKPVFTSLIRTQWARQASSFSGWLAELLPQLGAWFSNTTRLNVAQIGTADAARLAEEFDGDDRDLFTLAVRYAQFLETHGLFEPAWEKPPFDDTGADCFIFFPDCLNDYSEYKELLEASDHVRAIYTPRNNGAEHQFDFFFYNNSRGEISEAALYIRALNERENIRWDSIVVSIPDAENYEAYVLREFALRGIPFVKKTGKPLAAYSAGQFFTSAANCISKGFALAAVNELLLNSSLPWKDNGKIRRLIEFGIGNNCIASWIEANDGKELAVNVWEYAFGQYADDEYVMERGFFRDFKLRLNAMRKSGTFAELRKNYFIFREHFFDMGKCLPETDLILSRCISELGYLAEIEKSYPGVTVSDPYMFFTDYLGEKIYLAQQKESGVAILPYRTAAPAPFECHITIGASQESLSEVFSRLKFLPAYKRDKLGLRDEDASEVFIALHTANSFKRAAFFCAEDSFSGYAIPHSGLLGARANQAPKPLPRYGAISDHSNKFSVDLFVAENHFLNNVVNLSKNQRENTPQALYTAQKAGFLAWMARRNSATQPHASGSADGSLSRLIRERFFRDSEKKLMSVSASALEKYYQCPLIWLYDRALNLESVSFETDLMPYTLAGLVYHAVINEFLNAIKKDEKLLPPVSINGAPALPDSYNALLLTSLNKTFNAFPNSLHGDNLMMSALAARLLRAQRDDFFYNLKNFLAAFISYFSGCTVISTEAWYSVTSPDNYALNGRIDCILKTPSEQGIIVDFKTKTLPNINACNGTSENGLSNFQLPLYVTLAESSGKHEALQIHTALFFSIIDQLPQVLFGRIEDVLNETMVPKKEEDVIARDGERFNSIMKEFNEKILRFVDEIGSGKFLKFRKDHEGFEKCWQCGYKRICRTNYWICRERN